MDDGTVRRAGLKNAPFKILWDLPENTWKVREEREGAEARGSDNENDIDARAEDKVARPGRSERGRWADLVIFDLNKVRDKATYQDPHQYPEDIEYVIVNGKIVVDHGEHTGVLVGKVLRSTDRFMA